MSASSAASVRGAGAAVASGVGYTVGAGVGSADGSAVGAGVGAAVGSVLEFFRTADKVAQPAVQSSIPESSSAAAARAHFFAVILRTSFRF